MTLRLLIAALVAPVALASPAAAANPTEAAPPLAVSIQVAGAEAKVGYTVTLQSTIETPQAITITQRFSELPASVTASGDVKILPEGAQWVLVEVPPMQTVTLNTEAVFPTLSTPTRTTVCIAELTGQVRDCLTGDLPAEAVAERNSQPFPWSTVVTWAIVLAALAGAGYAAYRWRSKWYPQLAKWASPRREVLAVVGAAVAVMLVAAGLLGYVAFRTKAVVNTATGANSVLTTRGQEAMQVGMPAMAGRAEFTVYQWVCFPGEDRNCWAIMSIRNTAETAQPWHLRMQRLHETQQKWVEPSYDATVAANAGVDVFATPLAPGERRMASLVFKIPNQDPLSWLELRDGAYPRGVSLSVQ